MFTGIIKEIGSIKNITKKDDNFVIEIRASQVLKDLKTGDSVNVEGICSTVTETTKDSFIVSYMPETLKRTTVSLWKINDKLNLEPAMILSDKINGHLVQGHIDAIGSIKKITKGKDSSEIEVSYPQDLAKFIAFKGSVCVDGISLTVSQIEDDCFTVSIIPYTALNTTLGNKRENDKVNIEVDMISRYLKQLFDERDSQSSYEFLQERGFI